ncbi:DnaJsubfamily C member 1 [Manis javanica]|nr:DnaJsubfamily C member 1 [Manis javanica]
MTAPCSRPAPLPRSHQFRLVLSPQPPTPLWLLLLLAAAGQVRGWESGDLELFDLVEDVQLNFYQFLGVQQVHQGIIVVRNVAWTWAVHGVILMMNAIELVVIVEYSLGFLHNWNLM